MSHHFDGKTDEVKGLIKEGDVILIGHQKAGCWLAKELVSQCFKRSH